MLSNKEKRENYKVFGIGFHKTETTSLARAITILGYNVTGPNCVTDPDIGQNILKIASELAEQYDAFQDNPWPIIFREMDQRYPRSKFILTLRPTEKWIQSQVAHFGTSTTPMREWIYGVGCPQGNEDVYIARYEKHNAEVLEYFKDRPDDLLVLKITEGEGFEKLCPFLNKEIPDIAFPNVNKVIDRDSTISSSNAVVRIKYKLKRVLNKLQRKR